MTRDPRTAVIDDRLAAARRIVAVTGGKGGIGKSLTATALALALADGGRRVGLFDLDLTGPTDHRILGIDGAVVTETWGLDPLPVAGLSFMSVALFVGATPVPLRGVEFSHALLELLAVTRWRELDALVIDMPPGLGDATLDLVRHVRRAEYLVVATPSRVALETVRRTLVLLGRLRADVAGIVENMRRADEVAVAALAEACALPLLGAVPFDEGLEAAIGDPAALRRTRAYDAVRRVGHALFPPP